MKWPWVSRFEYDRALQSAQLSAQSMNSMNAEMLSAYKSMSEIREQVRLERVGHDALVVKLADSEHDIASLRLAVQAAEWNATAHAKQTEVANGRADAAEARYHALAEKITDRAFAPAPSATVVQPPESPESKIMRRVNEQALSNGTQAIMDMNPGMSEAEARGEAERMLMVADGVADSDNLTLLHDEDTNGALGAFGPTLKSRLL